MTHAYFVLQNRQQRSLQEKMTACLETRFPSTSVAQQQDRKVLCWALFTQADLSERAGNKWCEAVSYGIRILPILQNFQNKGLNLWKHFCTTEKLLWISENIFYDRKSSTKSFKISEKKKNRLEKTISKIGKKKYYFTVSHPQTFRGSNRSHTVSKNVFWHCSPWALIWFFLSHFWNLQTLNVFRTLKNIYFQDWKFVLNLWTYFLAKLKTRFESLKSGFNQFNKYWQDSDSIV